jgi:hypothetical protein
MMVRGAAKAPAPFRHFVRALLPFLAAQWLLLLAVLLVPSLVHLADNGVSISRAPAVPVSADEINKRLNEMVPLPAAPGD